jgi:hypothetical protein
MVILQMVYPILSHAMKIHARQKLQIYDQQRIINSGYELEIGQNQIFQNFFKIKILILNEKF